jgi:hypothetical protein
MSSFYTMHIPSFCLHRNEHVRDSNGSTYSWLEYNSLWSDTQSFSIQPDARTIAINPASFNGEGLAGHRLARRAVGLTIELADDSDGPILQNGLTAVFNGLNLRLSIGQHLLDLGVIWTFGVRAWIFRVQRLTSQTSDPLESVAIKVMEVGAFRLLGDRTEFGLFIADGDGTGRGIRDFTEAGMI